jgi:hypothetical protein
MSDPRPSGDSAFELRDEHKEGFRSLATSMSFVGATGALFGLLSVVFAMLSYGSGFSAAAVVLSVSAVVQLLLSWWTMAAGRSFAALVRTRGRDVEHLMFGVGQLRRIYGAQLLLLVVTALGFVASATFIVWCELGARKGGTCAVIPGFF